MFWWIFDQLKNLATIKVCRWKFFFKEERNRVRGSAEARIACLYGGLRPRHISMGDRVDFKLVTSGFSTFPGLRSRRRRRRRDHASCYPASRYILDPLPRWALDLLLKRGKIYFET